MSRLLTDDQLVALAVPPRERIAAHLAAGDVDAAVAALGPFEAALHAQVDRYDAWVANIVEVVADTQGRDGLAGLQRAVRAFLGASPDVGHVAPTDPAPLGDDLRAAVAVGGPADALAVLDERLDAWRHVIDLLRDWISVELGHVSRTGGPDALEAALRFCGARTLVAGLEADIARPPVERLERFVALLHGHFTDLTVTEDDRRFAIRQDPCGTCSRQVRDGRYAAPMDLAVAADDHAVTWGGLPTTIYRTHIPVWHVLMARERIGVPWPVNRCPVGVEDGPCTILLYKDPLDPAANDEVPGTL